LLTGKLVQPLHDLRRDDLPELFLGRLALKLARQPGKERCFFVLGVLLGDQIAKLSLQPQQRAELVYVPQPLP